VVGFIAEIALRNARSKVTKYTRHQREIATQANSHAPTLSLVGEGARQGKQPTRTGERERVGAGEVACEAVEGTGLQRGSTEGRCGLSGSNGSNEPAALPHTGSRVAESAVRQSRGVEERSIPTHIL